MKRRLVDYLCEHGTSERFALMTTEESDEVLSGTLRSVSGREYSIQDGIPSFVAGSEMQREQKDTVDSFSWKWDYAKNYRENTQSHYVQWYLDRYGFGTREALGVFLASKKMVLDAGTAHGRDAEMYASAGTAEVFGVDISSGIRLAYRDLAGRDNVHLLQADLMRLPFPQGMFDFIACDQVLHHTPDTYAGLRALLSHLATGGHIAFYVYRVKGPIREFCDDYIRERTVRMSPDECLKFAESMTRLGKALSDLNVVVDVPEAVPLLGIEAGPQDVQRFIYWNVFKCYWNDTMDWESNVITNFDWYHPLHAHRHTREEVLQWCETEGLEIEHMDVQESGISVLARKRS